MANPPYQQGSTSLQAYLALLSSTALQQPNAAAWVASNAALLDAEADRQRMAVKARFAAIAPADALAALGFERMVVRGLSESDAAYAARIQLAWTTWPWGGTAYGMLQAFKGLGYTDVVIAQVRGGVQFSLDASGNLVTAAPAGPVLWETDTLKAPYGAPYDQAFWSKFDVLFVSPLPGGWPPASNSDEANRIRLVIRQWKPAHATCNRIVIVTAGGGCFGYPPTQTWGDGSTWGGDAATYWTP